MKKYKSFIPTLGAALLLSLGSAFCAQAADIGWVTEDGTWRYKDASGNYVTNTWKTSGGSSFYLGSDGKMTVNQWIDDEYYVNDSGAMVKNSWIHITEEGGSKPAGWYYTDSKGKLERDGWETIGTYKYAFDSDGRMRTGWFFDGDDIYYLGGENQGYAKTGWQCLDYDEEDKPEDGDISEARSSASDSSKWFYFQSNGKAKRADDRTYAVETINDRKYYFNEDGVMMTGWIAAEEEAEAGDTTGISRFVYLGDENDGTMAKDTWLELTEHPASCDDKDELAEGDTDEMPEDGDSNWYYFESDGTPAYLNAKASSMSRATTKVNGDSYFFNPYGVRQTGMIRIVNQSGEEMVGYFEDSNSDGKMVTGKKTNLNVDGDSGTYYFADSGSDKGAGLNGTKDGYLYYQGRLVEAEDGSDFEVFEVKNRLYLVNESGKVQTDSKNYKVDGSYMYKISGGTIYYIDDDKNVEGKVEASDASTLPEVIYDKEYVLNGN